MIKGLSYADSYSPGELHRLNEYTANPGKTMAQIAAQVSRLKALQVPEDRATHPSTWNGWACMRDLLRSEQSILEKGQLSVFVGGNILYDPPISFNLKIDILAQTDFDPLLEHQTKWERNLNGYFPDNWECIFDAHNWAEIESLAANSRSKDLEEIEESAEEIDFEFCALPAILTGVPVFTPNSPAGKPDLKIITSHQQRLLTLLAQNPVLAGIVLLNLEEEISIIPA